MAPKKTTAMEEPPSVSSSEEGDSSPVDDDDGEEVSAKPLLPETAPATTPQAKPTSSEDSDSDSGSESVSDTQDSEKPLPQPTQKQSVVVEKPKTDPATLQAKTTSSQGSESVSESESEPDATPKPMEATKPQSKRPNESESAEESNVKRAKKSDHHEEGGEDTKNQLFKRLWSEDDEIVILKGMMDYWEKNGVDPNQDTQAFFDFIKDSLHAEEVNRNKLVDKMRRLKKKFMNNLKRGVNPSFSKAHEKISFDLSKNFWGTGGVIESAFAKSNQKEKQNQNQKGNNKSLQEELLDDLDFDNDGHKRRNSMKEVLFDKSFGMAGLGEFVLNNGLEVIGGAKKDELEAKWKKLKVAQLKLFLQWNELVTEQAKLILETMKSPGK